MVKSSVIMCGEKVSINRKWTNFVGWSIMAKCDYYFGTERVSYYINITI